MKGIIFNLLEKYVIENFGDDVMEGIYEKAEFTSDAPPFVGPVTYPDSDLFAILNILTKKTNLSLDNLIYKFGKYVFPTLAVRYPVFFENVNSTLGFLKKVNDIHYIEVMKLYEDATPPTFRIEEINQDNIKFHYNSHRKLCKLVEGLLDGVADYFGEKISYSQQQCLRDGADSCIFNITIEKQDLKYG